MQYSDHGKHRYESVKEQKKKTIFIIFIDKKLAIRIIVGWWTTSVDKFIERLGFRQYDVILTTEQSVLIKIMSSFEEKNVQTQYNVLGYRSYLYFHDYSVAIEIDENGHSDRSIVYGMKIGKAIEQELGCKFTRIDSEKE